MRRKITFLVVVLTILGMAGYVIPHCYAQEAKTEEIKRAKVVMVDNFEGSETRNLLGGKANVYVQAPSRIMISRNTEKRDGRDTQTLMIKYDKKNLGGPYGKGGWCGYYSLVKTDDTYFDATGYNAITFWVKGAKGDENFKMGLADQHWDRIGDSLKSEDIGVYLEAGKITTDWQKATVPFDTYFLDYKKLSSVAICFEGNCFPDGSGQGIIYIDDVAIE